jgi:hypothetical protein
MKTFKPEIEKFYHKLIDKEYFAFSKYADGEWLAMQKIDCTPGNGEWTISPETEHSSQLLINSFRYQHKGYYVGISCPCCQGANHYLMKQASGQDDDHLTFANLFVNANYQYFLDYYIPEFTKRSVVLVANRNSNINTLPFAVEDFWGVGYNAWVEDLDLISLISNKNYQDKLILFSCGPLGNILSQQLWERNQQNTYIDIGSTIDRWLNNDIFNKRLYAIGDQIFSNKVCVWGNE